MITAKFKEEERERANNVNYDEEEDLHSLHKIN